MNKFSAKNSNEEIIKKSIEIFVKKTILKLREANFEQVLLLQLQATQASLQVTPEQINRVRQTFLCSSDTFAEQCATCYMEQKYPKLAQHSSFKLSPDEVYKQVFKLFQTEARELHQSVIDKLDSTSSSLVSNSMFKPDSITSQKPTIEDNFAPDSPSN